MSKVLQGLKLNKPQAVCCIVWPTSWTGGSINNEWAFLLEVIPSYAMALHPGEANHNVLIGVAYSGSRSEHWHLSSSRLKTLLQSKRWAYGWIVGMERISAYEEAFAVGAGVYAQVLRTV